MKLASRIYLVLHFICTVNATLLPMLTSSEQLQEVYAVACGGEVYVQLPDGRMIIPQDNTPSLKNGGRLVSITLGDKNCKAMVLLDSNNDICYTRSMTEPRERRRLNETPLYFNRHTGEAFLWQEAPPISNEDQEISNQEREFLSGFCYCYIKQSEFDPTKIVLYSTDSNLPVALKPEGGCGKAWLTHVIYNEQRYTMSWLEGQGYFICNMKRELNCPPSPQKTTLVVEVKTGKVRLLLDQKTLQEKAVQEAALEAE